MADRRFVRGLGTAVAIIAVVTLWLGLGVGGDTVVLYVDDLVTLAAAAVAAVLCLRAGLRDEGRLRRFWLLFAAASAAWAFGELIWGVYDLVLRTEAPFPSWADLGYLGAIPLAVAALLSHPALRNRGGTGRARSVLDSLVVATALLFLSWALVLGALWRSTDLTTSGGVVALAYPFSDVILVFFVVFLTSKITRGERTAIRCLLMALVAMALSDSLYAYLTTATDYASGNLIDVGWIVGYVGIALAAYSALGNEVAPGEVRPAESRKLTPAAILVPTLPVLGALTFAAVRMELGHRLDQIDWDIALTLVLLVIGRQTLLILELFRPEEKTDEALSERMMAALGGPMTDPRADT